MATTIIHSFSSLLLYLAMILYGIRLASLSKRVGLATLVAAALVLAFPVNGMPMLYYFRALFGNLSLLSTCFFMYQVWHFISPNTRINISLSHYGFIAITGLALYITALGLGPFDLYALGYGMSTMWLLLGLLLIVSIYIQAKMITLIWILSVIIFFADIFESDNLWDYLIDPVIWFVAVCKLISNLRQLFYPHTHLE